jgi:hypothetical protein
LEDPIKDKYIFVNKIEEFCNKFKKIGIETPLIDNNQSSPRAASSKIDK